MKKSLLAICFAFLLLSGLTVPGQSRRITQPASVEKTNRRPAPVATPSPDPDSPPTDVNAEDDGNIVSVETEIVSIPVRVLDRSGRFIGGLNQSSFKVFEDGVEQEIGYFTNEAQPFTVALVLDMSYSSTFKISDIQLAAISFIDQLRPADKVMVVSFDSEVQVLCEATADRTQIYKAINQAKIAMGTSLYEAVDLVVNDRLGRVKGRKAMVLFTDGVDTTSETSHDRENLNDALESETLIYPIRYDTFNDVQKIKNAPPTGGMPGSLPPSTPPSIPTGDPSGLPFPIQMIAMPSSKGTSREEYAHAEQYLDELANRTGGRTYLASSFGNLTDAFSKIASELREYYSIGYSPKVEGKPGKIRRLRVVTDQEKVVVRARATYVIPDKTKPKKKFR